MGLSYRKSTKVGKNSRVSVGLKSTSFSTGVKGARVSVNSKGRARMSLSLPGTGLRYTKSFDAGTGLLMMCVMGTVNFSFWLIKVTFILMWWLMKVTIWGLYQTFRWTWIGIVALYNYIISRKNGDDNIEYIEDSQYEEENDY